MPCWLPVSFFIGCGYPKKHGYFITDFARPWNQPFCFRIWLHLGYYDVVSAPSRSQLASCMGAALCKHLMWDRWCACTNVVGSRNRRPCCITSVGHHDDFQAFGCSNKQNSRKKLSFFQIPNRKDVRIFVGNGSTTSEMQNLVQNFRAKQSVCRLWRPPHIFTTICWATGTPGVKRCPDCPLPFHYLRLCCKVLLS